jgi:hypothetical protein
MPSPSLLPLPLEHIIQDVRRAINARLYYPALVVSLTIPEICVSLTFDIAKSVKERRQSQKRKTNPHAF